MRKIGLFLICGILSACGDQNPFSEWSYEVQNAVAPEKDDGPPVLKAESEEVLRWNIPDGGVLTFNEGEHNEIILSGRLLKSVNGEPAKFNKDFEIVVENLEAFPGGEYNPAEGKFSWTPPIGTVSGFSPYSDRRLRVRLTTLSKPILGRQRDVLIYIRRANIDPEIEVIGLDSPTVREGEKRGFEVRVKDPISISGRGLEPKLHVRTDHIANNLGGYVRMINSTRQRPNPSQDPDDPSIWVYRMELNLEKVHVTKLEGTFRIHFEALSFSGNQQGRAETFRVLPTIREPKISWTDKQTVYLGENNTLMFTIHEPNYVGNFTGQFENCRSLIGQDTFCACDQPVGTSGLLHCVVRWSPPLRGSQNLGRLQVLRLRVTAESPVSGDSYPIQTFNFNLPMEVVSGGK